LNIIIRPFEPSDLDQVLEIERKSFPKNQWYDEEIFMEYHIRDRDLFLVACLEDRVVGYVIGSLVEDYGHIVSIAVSPEHRGKGIGKKLLNEIENRLIERGAKLLLLEVGVDNEVAIRMYLENGYKQIAVLAKYYGDRDAYLMIKQVYGNT